MVVEKGNKLMGKKGGGQNFKRKNFLIKVKKSKLGISKVRESLRMEVLHFF